MSYDLACLRIKSQKEYVCTKKLPVEFVLFLILCFECHACGLYIGTALLNYLYRNRYRHEDAEYQEAHRTPDALSANYIASRSGL
jgi:hypothetical protein